MAATPAGMQVRIRAELLEVQGRKLLFKVEAWDEVEKIAEGEHERFIINWERFMKGVTEKQGKIKK
jgi:predicted thioesterase